MNVYRALSGAGLAAGLGVQVWQMRSGPGSSSFSDLAFVGVAVGLFLANAFPALRLNLWQVGVAFLLLALGSPTAWLLGGFAGMGAVMLWQAYQIKTGEEGKA